jgi:isopentenyl-diphosphate delta-isomerase
MNQSRKRTKESLPSAGGEISLNLLIQVDEKGRKVGLEHKEKCHQGEGVRHRAFLVMIFDRNRRLLLARRSRLKKLWPRFWDGTVAGHYYAGSHFKNTPRLRVGEELGFGCGDLKPLFDFRYVARFNDLGIEKEVCHVFAANHHEVAGAAVNRDEVSELNYLEIPKLSEWVRAAPGEFTPWFLLAFQKGKENGLL